MTCPCRSARRERQLREVTALVDAGAHERAEGLALEHLACFPDDAGVLAEAGALTVPTTPAPDAGPDRRKDR